MSGSGICYHSGICTWLRQQDVFGGNDWQDNDIDLLFFWEQILAMAWLHFSTELIIIYNSSYKGSKEARAAVSARRKTEWIRHHK